MPGAARAAEEVVVVMNPASPRADTLTIVDRRALGELLREPRLEAQPRLNPEWLARMANAGWLVVDPATVVVHPAVADWFGADGALTAAHTVWQAVPVTLECVWDAANEPAAPWVTGYTDGTRWNGSLSPLVTAEAVRLLLERVGPYRYDAEADAFVVMPDGTDIEDRFVGRPVVVTPGAPPRTLYGVDGWFWMEMDYSVQGGCAL